MHRFTLIRTLLVIFSTGLLLLLASPASAEPSDADIQKAVKHMKAGVAFMQDPDGAKYEEAYPEFKKAYELSGSLNALLNLAICAQNLELDGEAIRLYEQFLKDKGEDIDPADKEQVDKDLTRLKATVAWVTIKTDKPGAILTDVRTPRRGARITNEYPLKEEQTLGIHPGKHVFTATYSGQKQQTWSVSLKNGEKALRKFNFGGGASSEGPVTAEGFTQADQAELSGEPQPDQDGDEEEGDEGGIPAYVWVIGGITVAAVVPMAIFMAQSSSQKAEYDDARGKVPIAEQETLRDELSTTNLLADVFLGVAAAGAVTTTILLIASLASGGGDEEEKKDAEDATETAFGVDFVFAPSFDPRGGGGAVLTGRF